MVGSIGILHILIRAGSVGLVSSRDKLSYFGEYASQ